MLSIPAKKWNDSSLDPTELLASEEHQHWQQSLKSPCLYVVHCIVYVKTDFSVLSSWSVAVFIFTRERGHFPPLSVFSALTQTERDSVKAKTGQEMFWFGLMLGQWNEDLTSESTGTVIRLSILCSLLGFVKPWIKDFFQRPCEVPEAWWLLADTVVAILVCA